MNKKATISVIIATENNPELVEKCLSRLSFADEFLVTDLSNNNKIEQMLMEKFPKAKHYYDIDRNLKNRQLKYQEQCNCDYMLMISPDEFYTQELIKELEELFSNEEILQYDTLGLKSLEFNFGNCFGQSAYFTYRIMKKGLLKYYTDNVHEEQTPVGKIYHLKGVYEHHSNPMLAVNAVKMFKFEMINAQKFTDEELHQASIEKMSGFQLFKTALTNWLRLSVRFWRAFKNYRKYGYGGLCYAYSDIIRVIAEHTSPTQELQFREGRVNRNDTRGYL